MLLIRVYHFDILYNCIIKSITILYSVLELWVILLNLVHTGYLQFLAIFHDLAGNEHDFLPKTRKVPINTQKKLRFF